MTDWKDIRAITFDVDGVMTDGGLIATDDGSFLRLFNAKDSFAIRMAVMNGYKVGVFTGGDTPGIRSRMISAGVPEEEIYMHCRGKLKTGTAFCAKHGLTPEGDAHGLEFPTFLFQCGRNLGVRQHLKIMTVADLRFAGTPFEGEACLGGEQVYGGRVPQVQRQSTAVGTQLFAELGPQTVFDFLGLETVGLRLLTVA